MVLEIPVNTFRISFVSALVLALALLVSSPQLRADGIKEHGSFNFSHQNFNEGNQHFSSFNSSDNSDKDNKDKDKGTGFGSTFGDGNSDHHDIDVTALQVATPEPAVFSLVFAGLIAIFALITWKKANA